MGLFQVGGEGDQLAIFLAELLPEDVCTTMYAAQYPNRTAPQVYISIWDDVLDLRNLVMNVFQAHDEFTNFTSCSQREKLREVLV